MIGPETPNPTEPEIVIRILLIFTATAMTLLIGVQFLGEPDPVRPFEGMTVVIMSGSDDWGGLRRVIEDASNVAEDTLGCTVERVFVDWNDEAIVDEFRRFSSIVPTGICFMGYPGPEALIPELEDLREMEVAFSTYNSRFPEGEARYGTEGFGFVGIDGFAAGKALVEAAIEKHALSAGDTAMLAGDLDHPARLAFRDGCLEAFAEGGLNVMRRVITSAQLATNPGPLADEIRDMAAAGTLPSVVCLTEFPVSLGDDLFQAAEIEPGSLPLIGLGMSPRHDRNNYDSGRGRRYVSLVASQDTALQAYLSILQVCMRRAIGATGLHIETPFEIIGLEDAATPVLRSDELRTVQVY